MSDQLNIASQSPVRVAVFAHNEQRNIETSIEKLLVEGEACADFQIHVLVNGSTDQTAEIAKACAKQLPDRVFAHEFKLGDKAATWNRYVYGVSQGMPEDCVHVFTDADVWPKPGSIVKMAKALRSNPEYAVVAGLPMSGRNRDKYRQLAKEKYLVFGNLYATRGSWLKWAREIDFRLPRGLVFEDAILTNAFMTTPDDLRKSSPSQIAHLNECGYCFTPIRPWLQSEVCLYARRMVRYRLATAQLKHLGWRWPDQLPESMDEINSKVLEQIQSQRPTLRPVDFFLARKLKKQFEKKAA